MLNNKNNEMKKTTNLKQAGLVRATRQKLKPDVNDGVTIKKGWSPEKSSKENLDMIYERLALNDLEVGDSVHVSVSNKVFFKVLFSIGKKHNRAWSNRRLISCHTLRDANRVITGKALLRYK